MTNIKNQGWTRRTEQESPQLQRERCYNRTAVRKPLITNTKDHLRGENRYGQIPQQVGECMCSKLQGCLAQTVQEPGGQVMGHFDGPSFTADQVILTDPL